MAKTFVISGHIVSGRTKVQSAKYEVKTFLNFVNYPSYFLLEGHPAFWATYGARWARTPASSRSPEKYCNCMRSTAPARTVSAGVAWALRTICAQANFTGSATTAKPAL